MHDINEDSRTISSFGGRWGDGLYCGVSHRRLHNTLSAGSVASRLALEHNQKATEYLQYTDEHDINEDISTISRFGGIRRNGLQCGMFYRALNNDSSAAIGGYASRSIVKVPHYFYSHLHGLP